MDMTAYSGDMQRLLEDTVRAVLEPIVSELSGEIDLRAKGFGKSVPVRVSIYLLALLRDLARIPRHYSKGIGQAQFRFRVSYITNTAIPTVNFFLHRYPLEEKRRRMLRDAVRTLEKAAQLITDGRIRVVDEWYATMEEFYQLTEYSREAAAAIEDAIAGTD